MKDSALKPCGNDLTYPLHDEGGYASGGWDSVHVSFSIDDENICVRPVGDPEFVPIQNKVVSWKPRDEIC